MCNHLSSIRTLIVIATFSVACPSLALAQFDGGNLNGGQTGGGDLGGNTGGNTGGNNQAGGGASIGALNADDAFSGIERGNTVGATNETGAGFSDAGVGGGGIGGGFGGFGGGGFGGGGFGGGLGGLFGGQGFGGQSQNSQPVIRTRLRSAIEGSYPRTQSTGQNLNYRLQTVSRRAGLTGVNVAVDGSTAIVTGVVATEKQRRMSELLMRLEPGVRNVENRVVVSP